VTIPIPDQIIIRLSLERVSSSTSVIDVLDHVLDKGIVIDAWVRVSLVGVDLLTIEARVVVASIQTYVNYADSLSEVTARSVVSPRTLKHAEITPPSRPER
jgi:hypothetical protein